MESLIYDFSNLKSKTKLGTESTFQGIKDMIERLDQGDTYYHFIGHADNTWNEIGLSDRARKEIVPIKKNKHIKTVGLYYPAKWVQRKFGGEIAKKEMRDMSFFPKDVIMPIRFYCYQDKVYYIFEQTEDFSALEIQDKEYTNKHIKLIDRLKDCKFSSQGVDTKLNVAFQIDSNYLFQKGIASFMLLDLICNNHANIYLKNKKLKYQMQDLIENSKGINLSVV